MRYGFMSRQYNFSSKIVKVSFVLCTIHRIGIVFVFPKLPEYIKIKRHLILRWKVYNFRKEKKREIYSESSVPGKNQNLDIFHRNVKYFVVSRVVNVFKFLLCYCIVSNVKSFKFCSISNIMQSDCASYEFLNCTCQTLLRTSNVIKIFYIYSDLRIVFYSCERLGYIWSIKT